MTQAVRCDIEWDGRRWSVDGELLELDERMSIWERTYRPRRLTLRAPLGDLRAFINAGHHPHSMIVDVFLGGRLISTSPVQTIEPGRSVGEWTTIDIVERPLVDLSQIPSPTRLLMRYVDAEATERAAQRAYRRATADMYMDGLYPASPLKPVNKVGDFSWSTVYAEKVVGTTYPMIFGRPGEDGAVGSKALPIDLTAKLLMVAGHACTEGTITIWGPANGHPDKLVSEAFNVTHAVDQNGQRVAVVDVSGSADLEVDWLDPTAGEAAEREWYASWNGTASGLSGDAADVLVVLLSHVRGVTVDLRSVEAARSHLAGYALSGCIDDVVRAWDVLIGQVLPLLPVHLVPTVAGVGLQPVVLDATAAEARWHLQEGHGIVATSRPTWRSADGDDAICNDFTLSWGPSRKTSRFRRSSRRGPLSDATCARSAELHGVRSEALETRWVYRAAVADRIVADVIAARATDRRQVALAVDGDVYGVSAPRELALGMVVLYTDSTEGIDRAVALVTSIVRDGSRTDRVLLTLLS